MAGNNITGTTNAGIYLYEAVNDNVTQNIISEAPEGIFDVGSTGTVMAGNNITNASYAGIELGSENDLLTLNIISEAPNGIYDDGSTGTVIAGNNITNSSYGIWLYYATSDNLTQNIISEDLNGIFDSDSTGTVMAGNNITNASSYGIWLDGAQYDNLTQNNINGSVSYSYYVSYSSSYNSFTNNTISGDLWVYDDSENLNANYYNNSFMGNIYYLANGTPASSFCNITSSTGTWADGGSDLPFSSSTSCLSEEEWSGSGEDWHPWVGSPIYFISLSPANGYSSSSTTQTFSFTVGDNLFPTVNCTLYIDGSDIANNASVSDNVSTSFTTTLSISSHTWYVNCSDEGNNSLSSSPRNITIQQVGTGCAYNNPSCTSPQVCVDNACVTPSGCEYNNPSCPSGYQCVSNQCEYYYSYGGGGGGVINVQQGCAYNNPMCGIGYDCINNTCVSAGSTNQTTPPNQVNTTEMLDLQAPASGLLGSTITIKVVIAGTDTPVPNLQVEVISPTHERLTITTDTTGEANYVAEELGVYQYSITNPVLEYRITNIYNTSTTNQNMTSAQSAISDANATISSAENAGKNMTDARKKLNDANAAFNAGNYTQAEQLAHEAEQLALNASAQASNVSVTAPPVQQPFDWTPICGAVVLLVLLIIAVMYLRNRNKGEYEEDED
jgi:parallel beta-helix repeat protein